MTINFASLLYRLAEILFVQIPIHIYTSIYHPFIHTLNNAVLFHCISNNSSLASIILFQNNNDYHFTLQAFIMDMLAYVRDK